MLAQARHPNGRAVLALRTLADRLEAETRPVCVALNHALSLYPYGVDDADKLNGLLVDGVLATLAEDDPEWVNHHALPMPPDEAMEPGPYHPVDS